MKLRGLYVLPVLGALFLHPASGAAQAADNVAGNLITFDNDGMWSWYMDERVIVDPTNDAMVVDILLVGDARCVISGAGDEVHSFCRR